MLEHLLKDSEWIIKCPECGNNTKFNAHSQQVSEDFCEVWVECKCGYDPTAEQTGARYEDVWGGVHENNVRVALECWNDAINDLNSQKKD